MFAEKKGLFVPYSALKLGTILALGCVAACGIGCPSLFAFLVHGVGFCKGFTRMPGTLALIITSTYGSTFKGRVIQILHVVLDLALGRCVEVKLQTKAPEETLSD